MSAEVVAEGESRQISRHEVKEVLDVLKTLPDFNRLAFPANIHKEFNIPMDNYISETIMDFYALHVGTRISGGEKGETRPPVLDASGNPIIRPLLSFPDGGATLEIVTEKQPELEDTTSPSTEDDTQESQRCPDESSPRVHDA